MSHNKTCSHFCFDCLVTLYIIAIMRCWIINHFVKYFFDFGDVEYVLSHARDTQINFANLVLQLVPSLDIQVEVLVWELNKEIYIRTKKLKQNFSTPAESSMRRSSLVSIGSVGGLTLNKRNSTDSHFSLVAPDTTLMPWILVLFFWPFLLSLTIFIDHHVNHCLTIAVGFPCLLLERVQCHVQVGCTGSGDLGWPAGICFGRCCSGRNDDKNRQLPNVHDVPLYLC